MISIQKKYLGSFWNPAFPAKLLLRCSSFVPLKRNFSRDDKQEHILVVKLDEIGDVVLASGFLRELRKNFPNAFITLVVNPVVFNLVELCPYVNRVLTFAPLPKAGKLRNYLHAIGFARHHFTSRHYRYAIFPRWDYDHTFSSLLVFLSNAEERIGYSELVNLMKENQNRHYDKFFSKVIQVKKLRHEVEHIFQLIRELGGNVQHDELEIWTSPEDDRFVDDLLKKKGIGKGDKILVYSPGAGAFKRRWPIEKFRDVCSWIIQAFGMKVVVVGSREEQNLGMQLCNVNSHDVVNVAGELSLRQTASLMKRCLLYVGNDSGLMHVAAALKLAVVEISCHPADGDQFHPNSPKRFGPWNTDNVILQPKHAQPPCVSCCDANVPHCIAAIECEEVQQAIEHLFRRMPNPVPKIHS